MGRRPVSAFLLRRVLDRNIEVTALPESPQSATVAWAPRRLLVSRVIERAVADEREVKLRIVGLCKGALLVDVDLEVAGGAIHSSRPPEPTLCAG